jgi:hypothetical protein
VPQRLRCAAIHRRALLDQGGSALIIHAVGDYLTDPAGLGSAAGMRAPIGKVIQSKRKISGEREDDEPLADNQRNVAYAYELDEDYQNRHVPDAHAGKRQVMRRLGPVDTLYLEKNINIQRYVGKERE